MSEYENTPCPDMPYKWCTEMCPSCNEICFEDTVILFCSKYCKEVIPNEIDVTRPDGM